MDRLNARRSTSRRKFGRIAIDAAMTDLRVLGDEHQDAALLPLVSEDVSPEGLFVRTAQAHPLGTAVALRLHLPTMTEPLICQAQVVRIEERPNGGVRGVGLRFVALPEADRRQLVEHLYRSYQAQHVAE